MDSQHIYDDTPPSLCMDKPANNRELASTPDVLQKVEVFLEEIDLFTLWCESVNSNVENHKHKVFEKSKGKG